MKVRTLIAFKSKLLNPCRKLQPIFKFRFKRPFFLRALQVRRRPRQSETRKTPPKNRFTALLSLFCFQRQEKEMDRVRELRSISDAGQERRLFPSPLTPASMKAGAAGKRVASGHEDLEDACRSFENYLVEMIVEEGKVRDLMDVEELLYCWKNLKCPVFIDLICRFYGELCKDLFSTDEEVNEESPQ
ncbi:hypothetical protein PVL29_007778 [Vitis rotundifolia]|uniref:OVATE domain-containing protein n=1 Tax=Vitis rotundifolia TaxID=103349 RepID=A0AA39A2S6_VITRO|nr:hypothetical protein PVL29_007778 [Vitis rotundifolia]